MTISELANKAADYIEEHGWCRNQLRSINGSVCLLGALFAANKTLAELHGVDRKQELEAYRTEQAVRDVVGEYIPHWNDHVASSKEEVIQVLRDVAIKHQPDAMNVNTEEDNDAA